MDGLALIGRHQEIARLETACAAARTGRGSVVLVAGEVGVGKTRLVTDVLAGCDLAGFRTQVREETTPPYGPLTSLLRQILQAYPGGFGECGPLGTYLSLILPELGPCDETAGPEVLTEAVVAALVATARLGPTVLFIDDLQWADNATLELIPVLAARVRDEPLVLVAAYRSDEIPRDHPLRKLRDDLRRGRQLEEIVLTPLARDEVASLLRAALPAAPAADLVRLVHDRTQGVPLFVEELAHALVAGGHLEDAGQGLDLAPGQTMPLPESVRDAVLLRVGSLGPEARHLLDVAAVAGVEFSLALVTDLAGDEAGLDELIARQLVVERGDGHGAFRHALVREAVREAVPWSQRRSLDRRLAAYLERAGAPPEQVAEHWLAAGEHGPARAALLQLADHSCRLHAYRDATGAAHRALAIWPAGQDELQRLDALERLAHCAQVSGQLADAVQALREAAASPLLDGEPARRAGVQQALARVLGLQGAWEAAVAAHTAAAHLYEELGDAAAAAREWLVVTGRLTGVSALDRAIESARHAARLAAGGERTDLVARARAFEGNLLAMQGDGAAGRELAQQALSLALESGHTDVAAEVYRRLASVLDYCSDFAGSADAYATAVSYCRERDDDVNALVCLGCMSAIVYRTGEWKRALEICGEVADDPDTTLGSRALAVCIRGLIQVFRGKIRDARRHLEAARSLCEQGDVVVIDLFCEFGLAVVAELEGRDDRAAELHQQVLERWRTTQDRHDMVPFFLWQATFFGRRGAERETSERADALARMAAGTANPETLAALGHALGEVALLAGDAAAAAARFGEALAQAEKLEVPLELAITSWRLGIALQREGDQAGAVRRLHASYRILRRLGARPLAATVAAALSELGEPVEEGRHPDASLRAGRGGLTRRQVEIVRLVADGLSNREIAARLFLSPRTVDMHVRNILDRLDCRSRVEAARVAGDLELLD